VKAKGAVGYSTAQYESEGMDDPVFAIVLVLLEVDPSSDVPTADVPPNLKSEMIAEARAMADEMFRARHPRARVIHK
jgi:hypothetical protein